MQRQFTIYLSLICSTLLANSPITTIKNKNTNLQIILLPTSQNFKILKSELTGKWEALLVENKKCELKSVHVHWVPPTSDDYSGDIEIINSKSKYPELFIRGHPLTTSSNIPFIKYNENDDRFQFNNSGLVRPITGKLLSKKFKFITSKTHIYFNGYFKFKVTYFIDNMHQILFSSRDEDDVSDWKLRWCGDLDGDGFPDFILYDTIEKYVYEVRLYLSSLGKNGAPLGLAAKTYSVGE